MAVDFHDQLFSYNRGEPRLLPKRHRKPDGTTVTDLRSLREDEIIHLGYTPYLNESKRPAYDPNIEEVQWDLQELNWRVVPLSDEQIEKNKTLAWENLRQEREALFIENDQRVSRYHSQVRLGLTPTDDLNALDTYAQALRDLTDQDNPFEIVWPTRP